MRFNRALLLPVIAVAATVLVLWYIHRPAPAVTSSMAQVRQEAQDGGYRLIDADALWKLYQSERDNILLVDTRQEWEHRAGHIDGSVNFPFEPTVWARWHRRGDLKSLLGPDREKKIIFY